MIDPLPAAGSIKAQERNNAGDAAARAWRWIRAHPLPFILLLGLLLRVIALDSRGLQYDDVFSIFLARRSPAEIISGSAADTMPPLYFFLLHAWMALEPQVWFIRLLTVLLSLAAASFAYLLARHLFGQTAARWAGLLAAISPLQIYHAQDVRMYALLVLGQIGYIYFFARIFVPAAGESRPRASGWHWGGLILCGLAAMYAHNVAVFGLIVPDLFLLVKRDFKGLLKLLAAQLVIGLLALPWLLLLPGQVAKVQRAWSLPYPGLVEVVQAIIMFNASMPLPFPLMAAAAIISVELAAILTIEAAGMLRREEGRADRSGLLLLGCLLAVPPILLFAASYVVKPMFIPRAFLVSSLAYAGIGGALLAKVWQRGAGKLLAGGFLLAALISLPSFYTFNGFPRSPFQQAGEALQSEIDAGSDAGIRVIHENKMSAFPMLFYTPGLPQVFLADDPGSANDTFALASQRAMEIYPQPDLKTAVGGAQEVYYVLFTRTYDEFKAMGLKGNPGQIWLDVHFQRVDTRVFNDLEIDHYRRKP